MTVARSLLDKLWETHEVLRRDDGTSLLWVDRHLVHEGSHHGFAMLAARKMALAAPELTFWRCRSLCANADGRCGP